MIDALFNQPNYAAVKKLLDATALRHEAIARNLANIETPGYKRVDLAPPFETALRKAISSRDAAQIRGVQPSLTVDSAAVASRKDGNTVQLESELLKLNQNSVAHSVETHLTPGQLLRLRMAITGRSA